MENITELRVATDRNVTATEEQLRIGIILTSMPETLRIPLVMCDIYELSYDEIAAALGIGLSAVKMRIKPAREHLRRAYGGEPSMKAQAAR